jgi:hypothetical protein
VVDRWAAHLAGKPEATRIMFRFLVSIVVACLGELRELKRLVWDGRPVVVLVSERDERLYQVGDPRLGEREAKAVDGMLAARGGG